MARSEPDRAPCRSCKAWVVWARTASAERPMPLDQDNARGNVLLDAAGYAHVFRDRAAALEARKAAPARFGPGSRTWISHHAQCPHGPAWRGKKRTDADAPKAVQGSLFGGDAA